MRDHTKKVSPSEVDSLAEAMERDMIMSHENPPEQESKHRQAKNRGSENRTERRRRGMGGHLPRRLDF